MKGRKRKNLRYPYISVLLLLGALFFSSIPAEASSGGFLEGYETEEGQMKLFCDIPENGEAAAEETQFAVTLSSQELPALGITTAGEEHTPMTFYCLVDVSGSMGQEQMDQAKAVLTAISQGMNENDNMVISSLGNQLSDSGFLSDKNAINAEIQNLQIGNEDTNLYAGIVKSIDILKTDIRVNPKKCLLILSDGQDDQKSGITQSEAEQAVLDSSIPIYTVATLPSDPSGGQLEFAKLLGSFARISVGGIHYAPVVDGTDASSVGQAILQKERNCVVLTLDTSQVDAEGKDILLLRVIYTAKDQTVLEDTMEIFSEDLKIAEAPDTEEGAEPGSEPESEPEEPEPEPAREPEPEPESEPDHRLWIAIGVLAVLVIIAGILAVFFAKKKKGEKLSAEESGAGDFGVEDYEEKKADEIEPSKEDGQAEQKENRRIVYEVRFTAIGYENICRTLQMEEGRVMTLGRDKRSELILNPEDKRLSGVHCKVCCEKNQFNIQDMDSRNGTFVNGVPIRNLGMTAVENGHTARMGSYEYRITIMRKEE